MIAELAFELEPTPTAGSRARVELHRVLTEHLARGLLRDVGIVVTELVNNAVSHGPGEPISVHLTIRDDGSIRGEVADSGDGKIAIREMNEDIGGYGLRIVDALTDRWAAYEGSTHVWFEMAGGDRVP